MFCRQIVGPDIQEPELSPGRVCSQIAVVFILSLKHHIVDTTLSNLIISLFHRHVTLLWSPMYYILLDISSCNSHLLIITSV